MKLSDQKVEIISTSRAHMGRIYWGLRLLVVGAAFLIFILAGLIVVLLVLALIFN